MQCETSVTFEYAFIHLYELTSYKLVLCEDLGFCRSDLSCSVVSVFCLLFTIFSMDHACFDITFYYAIAASNTLREKSPTHNLYVFHKEKARSSRLKIFSLLSVFLF